MTQYIYMLVTNDIYEFPVAMANSVQELARMIGVRPNSISSAMSHAKSRGQRCKYVKVELDEEEVGENEHD